MGSSYVWVCDDLKEFMRPHPLDEWHLFTYLSLGRWCGHAVRLLDDQNDEQQDEFYTVTSRDREDAESCGYDPEHIYRDVTEHARHYWRWLEQKCDCEPPAPPALEEKKR
jgi:hypothetical protein